MLKHSVVIELSQILNFRNTPLVELKIILLQAKADGLNDVVDHRDGKIGMVAVYGAQEYRKNVNAAVLNLARPRKYLCENSHNLKMMRISRWDDGQRGLTYLCLFPMKPSDLLEDFGVVSLSQIHVDELTNEQFCRRSLFLLYRGSFRWIYVVDCVLD